MRPKKLTMTAFGSYAAETTVNFDDLDKGLYLITGDTGAGKTTIFDAIVFALYGEASGDRRDAKMMHSDYVEPSQETVVQLVFEHGGREHTVERTIPVTKKRGTGNYELGNIQAKYWEAGKPVLEGAQKVTNRITEQLGLNGDQFRKIVMLAQGEFRKFLDSKDDERADIMRRLFDFSAYTKMQHWLEATAARLDSQRRSYVEQRTTLMKAFRMPEGLTEEQQSRYHADHPDLMAALEQLCEEDQGLLDIRDSARSAATKHQTELTLKLEQAKHRNGRLDELDRSRDRMEHLKEQEESNSIRRDRIEKAEKALRHVKPLENAGAEAREARIGIEQEISALKNTSAMQKDALEAAEIRKKGAHEKEAEIEELGTAIRQLEEMIPGYQQLDELRKTWKNADARHRAAGSDQKKWEERKQQASGRILAIDKELETLKDAEGALVAADNARQQAAKAQDALSRKRGLLEYVDSVRKGVAGEKTLLLNEQKTREAAVKANTVYTEAYQSFMANQAGFMANDLTEWIRRDGRGTCPVCRTEFCGMPAHGFAVPMQEAASQTEVDEAKACFELADKAYRKAAEDLKVHRGKLAEAKENAVHRAQELFGETLSWEILAGEEADPMTGGMHETYLERKAREFSQALSTADAALTAAQNRSDRKKVLDQDRKNQASLVTEADETLTSIGKLLQETLGEVTTLDTRIKEKQATLSRYADAKEASAEKAQKEKQKTELSARIIAADDAWKQAADVFSRTMGALEKKRQELPVAAAREKEAAEKFDAEILRQGFADASAYAEALPPVAGTKAGEDWISGQQEICRRYEQDCRDTAARVKDLSEETAQWQRTDLAALSEELRAAVAAAKAADDAYGDQHTILESHRETKKNVTAVSQSLRGTDTAYRRLSVLSGLAAGSKGVGGMYSFERYVMGASFREILEAANDRLSVMSGGRYMLVHKIAGKRVDSKVGLGIEVLDNGTGKQREANSISGGESFQVSMALALGLSDVVQRHAGAQVIDSMFIDEGFGSLSDHALEQAIGVLNQLAGDHRQIGIISHVAKLEEIISNRIEVRGGEKGSTATVRK